MIKEENGSTSKQVLSASFERMKVQTQDMDSRNMPDPFYSTAGLDLGLNQKKCNPIKMWQESAELQDEKAIEPVQRGKNQYEAGKLQLNLKALNIVGLIKQVEKDRKMRKGAERRNAKLTPSKVVTRHPLKLKLGNL